MYGNNMGSTLSLSKIIGGLSKTLNIVNQAIPLYNELRPILSNASGILSVFKEMNKPNPSKNNGSSNLKAIDTNIVETKKTKETPLSTNTLTFFQ